MRLVDVAQGYLAGGTGEPRSNADNYTLMVHVDETALAGPGGESDLPGPDASRDALLALVHDHVSRDDEYSHPSRDALECGENDRGSINEPGGKYANPSCDAWAGERGKNIPPWQVKRMHRLVVQPRRI